MLGEVELPQIEAVRALQMRRVADLPVPGLDGDLQQDLGDGGMSVEIVGSLQGDEARDSFLEGIRGPYESGEPVTFVADILTATSVEQVLIRSLTVEEVNDWSAPFRYRLVLREYVEPPPPPAPFDELGLDLDADLDLLAELGLEGLELPGLLADVPALGNPVEPLMPALDGVEAATEPVSGLLTGLRSALLD